MLKETVNNKRLNESYLRIRHDSGLTVLLYPMEGYSSCYALFGTKYGSIDRCFKAGKETEFTTVPDGIAHYLEHKVFENEDGDAFMLFAKTGASANAFTSFDRTCYLFSCTDQFESALGSLLSFVRSPYFTDENVQKEQGIIGQEIRMYEDDPEWRVYFNTLKALYHNHPVNVDIAGTVESIAKIDKDLLYRCYHVFYNLNNMVLAIAGNFSPDAALRVIDETLEKDQPAEIVRASVTEPMDVVTSEITQKLPVAIPLFAIGYKLPPLEGLARVRAEVECEIIGELIAGNASRLYRKLYDEGLVNDSFGADSTMGSGYFAAMFSGESRDPRQVRQALAEEVEAVKQNGVTEEAFKRVKKQVYGQYVRQFNNVEAVSNNLVAAHFSNTDIYDKIETAAAVTLADVEKRLADFDNGRSVLSVIEPA